MKKFIFTILASLAVIVLIDIVFGYACRYLSTHAKGGDTYSHNYVANIAEEDVIVMGSSRAVNHYIPYIMSDTLNYSVYNCGKQGTGIITMYGRLLMLTSRYTPKLIIYDVVYGFDILKNDNHKYLDVLKRFYDISSVNEIFSTIDSRENFKMKSNLYRYNTSFIQMLSDNVHPMALVEQGGFKPMFGIINYEPERNKEKIEPVWDEQKNYFFDKFVSLCKTKNIKLIFTISPAYKSSDDYLYNPIIQYCKDNNFILLNHYLDSEFNDNKLFVDPSHLNEEGAELYTKKISSEIKKILKYDSTE